MVLLLEAFRTVSIAGSCLCLTTAVDGEKKNYLQNSQQYKGISDVPKKLHFCLYQF